MTLSEQLDELADELDKLTKLLRNRQVGYFDWWAVFSSQVHKVFEKMKAWLPDSALGRS